MIDLRSKYNHSRQRKLPVKPIIPIGKLGKEVNKMLETHKSSNVPNVNTVKTVRFMPRSFTYLESVTSLVTALFCLFVAYFAVMELGRRLVNWLVFG